MTIYISEFWCGVLLTLLIQFVLLIVISTYLKKDKKEYEEKYGSEKDS